MKTALTRLSSVLPALLLMGAVALADGIPAGMFPSSIVGAMARLLAAPGGACCLLRHGIEPDDQARATAARLCLELKARHALEATLADTRTILSRVVRLQASLRQRLRAAGGKFETAPTPDGGSRIAMILPGVPGLVPG